MTNQEARTKNAKVVEYETAPSGAITLYNYKEPFMDFKDVMTGTGFGYEGVLMLDTEGDTLQCHFCGEWFNSLAHHVRKEHGMTSYEYKDIVGLNHSTALISENYRANLIKAKQKNGTLGKNLRPHTRKRTEEEKKKIADTLSNTTRQTQNIRGTCPLQLKYRLIEMAERLGRLPTTDECMFYDTAKKVYGSWKNFVEECGYEYRKPSIAINHGNRKYSKDEMRKMLENIFIKTGKRATFESVKEHYGWDLKKWKSVQAFISRNFNKGDKDKMEAEFKRAIRETTKKERLLILKGFYESNNRLPSGSDAKRGLITHLSWYYSNFGNTKNALVEAQKL